jgi:hypothetical protein
MTKLLFILVLALAVTLCPNYAQAQQPDKSQTKDAALREKAFRLLESVGGQLTNLQSPENRARLGANIADSLWNHDEKRARALFGLVQDDINNGLANRDLDDPNDLHTIKVFLKLRVDTVERIAKYDAELALAFLKSTEFVSDKPLPPNLRESEQGLEMRLARQMANSSPEHAVKLAHESLSEGLSNDLILLLRQVSKKNKEQALILYKAILKKLGDLDLTEDYKARQFAENLAQTFQPSDNSAFRALIGMFVTRALDHGCGHPLNAADPKADFCYWTASILPQLETIDPRAAQLKRWVRDEMNLPIAIEAIHQWFETVEDGSIDDLLAFAAKHPAFQENVYWEAIRRASQAGDFDQARKILPLVADSDRKEAMLTEIDRRQKSMPIDEKRHADVQKGLQYSNTTLDRVRYLLNYADFFGGYDHNAAMKLIKQASEMADTMKPGKDQTEARMLLAITYCSDKNDRGFTIMEPLMPKLNELVEAAVKLDGFETRYVRDGEWNMSAGGSVGELLTRLSQSAGSFAWCDFDRAVGLAAQFDRTEIRLMAHLKLAQAILAGPRHRPAIDFDYIYY